MFSKRHRLSRECFGVVRKSTSPIHTPFFSLYLTDQVSGCSGFATVVSRKVVGGIIERNKLKRRLSTALKEVFKRETASLSGILYAKKEAKGVTFERLRGEIKKVLYRSGYRLYLK